MPSPTPTRTSLARLAGGALFALAASLAGSQPDFAVTGFASRPGEKPSTGGSFVLSAGVVSPVSPLGDGDAPVRATALSFPRSPDGSLCFCGGPLFSDGFEAGNTGAWSAAIP